LINFGESVLESVARPESQSLTQVGVIFIKPPKIWSSNPASLHT